jgi:hypothetical protein
MIRMHDLSARQTGGQSVARIELQQGYRILDDLFYGRSDITMAAETSILFCLRKTHCYSTAAVAEGMPERALD